MKKIFLVLALISILSPVVAIGQARSAETLPKPEVVSKGTLRYGNTLYEFVAMAVDRKNGRYMVRLGGLICESTAAKRADGVEIVSNDCGDDFHFSTSSMNNPDSPFRGVIFFYVSADRTQRMLQNDEAFAFWHTVLIKDTGLSIGD